MTMATAGVARMVLRYCPTVSPGRMVVALTAGALVLAAAVLAATDRTATVWVGFLLLGLTAATGLAHFAPWVAAGLGVASGIAYAGWPLVAPDATAGAATFSTARFLFFLVIGLLAEADGRMLIRIERAVALGQRGVAESDPSHEPLVPWQESDASSALSRELARARRYHFNVAFALLEIDGWQPSIERRGRTEMVDILRNFTRQVRQLIRSHDEFAYLGSGRCSLLLPHTDLDGAHQVVERVRGLLSQDLGLKFHVGIAEFPDDAETEEELLSEAEAALDAASHGDSDLVSAHKPGRDAGLRTLE